MSKLRQWAVSDGQNAFLRKVWKCTHVKIAGSNLRRRVKSNEFYFAMRKDRGLESLPGFMCGVLFCNAVFYRINFNYNCAYLRRIWDKLIGPPAPDKYVFDNSTYCQNWLSRNWHSFQLQGSSFIGKNVNCQPIYVYVYLHTYVHTTWIAIYVWSICRKM
jgi:hypothetical protein